MLLFHNVKEKILFAANAFCSKWINPKKTPSNFQSILVVKLDEIGDMVMCMHLFPLIKLKYPNAQLDVLCKPLCTDLLINNPNINKVLTNVNEWNRSYELVIELRGTWQTLKQSIRFKPQYRLDRGTARIQMKLAKSFFNDKETNNLVLKPLLGTITENNPIFYPSNSDNEYVNGYIQKNGLQKFALLHATSNKKLKEWPQERFLSLADWLHKKGYDILWIGAKAEKELISELQQKNAQYTLNTAGAFTLNQLYVLCSKAAVYIGNDSGPMHIANAANTPLVGLFGPGPAHVFYPEGENVKIIHHVFSCNPCNQNTCIRPNDTCMDAISMAEVTLALHTLGI